MTETRNDGGTAFPLHPGINPDWCASAGMSLRDWFAGQALGGLLQAAMNDEEMSAGSPDVIRRPLVKEAYALADAMLAARGQP